MLAWVTLALGIAVLAGGFVAMTKVDRRWRAGHLRCCRCLVTWYGRAKMCERCGARGHPYDWLAERFAGFPTHDWQGYLDTGPIARVQIPSPREPVTWSTTPEPTAGATRRHRS